MDLQDVYDTVLDRRTKGLPGWLGPLPLRDLPGLGLNLLAEDLPLPVMVLKRSALDHNLALMSDYCRRTGALLAPHGKTSMSPQLFAEQLGHGAWGITVASVSQAQVARSFGVDRVVIANEVVGAPGLRYLAEELRADPGFDLYCWVDSAAAVAALDQAAARYGTGRPFQVLLELGWAGGRTGARTDEDVRAVVTAVRASAGRVVLAGVAVFEGLFGLARLPGTAAGAASGGDVEDFLAGAAATAQRLIDSGDLPPDCLLSGGGSTSFDAVVDSFGPMCPPARLLLRSGCYVTHDHGMNAALSPLSTASPATRRGDLDTLRPAFELWSYVNSVPEPGLAFLTFGRRDAPYDSGLPVPLFRVPAGATEMLPFAGAEVLGLNDQHCYLRHTPGELSVGDRVVLGISHPCTAFDKWQVIPVVDDGYTVVDAFRTYF